MKLLVEKLEIEITPEDQKLVTEYLLEAQAAEIQCESAGGASRMQTVAALIPILVQIFDKIMGRGVKFDPIDPPPVVPPIGFDNDAPPSDDAPLWPMMPPRTVNDDTPTDDE